MQKTALTLSLLAGIALVSLNSYASPVATRTETTYSKQNEVIMDGYTPLDVIDNSVKTSVRTYKNPIAQQPVAQQVQQPRPFSIPAQPVAQPMPPVVAQGALPSGYPAPQPVPAHLVRPLPTNVPVVNGDPVYTNGIRNVAVLPKNFNAIPVQATQPAPVPNGVACVAGQNCPSKISSIEYKQSPVKVQYPVVRQYPVSVEYPVTVNRDVTVRQPVVVEQPVVVQKPVIVNQPVMVERAPAYVRQQAVRMQQQPSFVQQQQIVVPAPAGQVLPPCTTGNCQ